MPVDHYENFPVASFLLPARLRPAVETIYAFARSADDLADEGQAAPGVRIAALEAYETALVGIENGEVPHSALFRRLQQIIEEYRLPLKPLHDLLSAFKQDVTTPRYETFAKLLDYCRRSANPVGRLLLHLYEAATEENVRDSDAICTALQLTNFWQDVMLDWRKARIYIPQEDMDRFGITAETIADARADNAWQALMRFEVERTREMMLSGATLALRLPGRIGWELRLIVQGGLRILERIEAADYDVFTRRPQLGPKDWMRMGWRAMNMHAGLSRMHEVG